MNEFSKSQFSYYLLSWMFHSSILTNKVNKLHENCLRLIYNSSASSLEIDNPVLNTFWQFRVRIFVWGNSLLKPLRFEIESFFSKKQKGN